MNKNPKKGLICCHAITETVKNVHLFTQLCGMTSDIHTCVKSEFFYSLSLVSFLSLQTLLKLISSRPCIPRNPVILEIEIEPLWKSAHNSFYHHITQLQINMTQNGLYLWV